MDYAIITNPTGVVTSEGMKPAKMDPVKITNLRSKFKAQAVETPAAAAPVQATPVVQEPVAQAAEAVAPVQTPVVETPVAQAPVVNKYERVCQEFKMSIYNNNMKAVNVSGIKKLKVNKDKVANEIINLSNNSNKVDIVMTDIVIPTIATKVEVPVQAPVVETPVQAPVVEEPVSVAPPVVEEPKVETPVVETPVVEETKVETQAYEGNKAEPTINVDTYLNRDIDEDLIAKKKARNEEANKRLEVLQQRLNDINSRLEETEKKKAEKALDEEFESITMSIDDLEAQIQEGLSKLGEN